MMKKSKSKSDINIIKSSSTMSADTLNVKVDGYAVVVAQTFNLGDDIQTYAALQILPQIDYYVIRDNMNQVYDAKTSCLIPSGRLATMRILTVVSGWYMHSIDVAETTTAPKGPKYIWPPPAHIIPIFVSVHFSRENNRMLFSSKAIAYYKQYEPIGCRDEWTLKELSKQNVKCYLSGCLTIGLKTLINSPRQLCTYYVVDNPPIISSTSTSNSTSNSKCEIINHIDKNIPKRSIASRLEATQKLLTKYSTAQKIITDRLHCYMPCMAFSTPVHFTGPEQDDRCVGLIGKSRAELLGHYHQAVRQVHRQLAHYTLKPPPWSLTVFLTTIGRPSLRTMLESLRLQMLPCDNLVIAIDGNAYSPRTHNILGLFKDKWPCPITIHDHPVNLGAWGHGLRNHYQGSLPGDYILHADDDDVYSADALSLVRGSITQSGMLYIFQMVLGNRQIIPNPDTISLGNIGTPCGVVANLPIFFGKWEPLRGGDCSFWQQTAQKFGHNKVKYMHKIIYHVIG
jgi:hypothetical protein